jgi:DNA-binding transcriptional ArsR family regulator
MTCVTAAELDRTFAALSDPTRRAILDRLTEREASLSELAKGFPVSIQAVAKHLKVLEEAGLVSRGREGQLRPARIVGAPLREAAEWIERYRPFWRARFQRLDRRLAAKRGSDA